MQLAVDGRRVYAATGGRAFDRALPTTLFLHGAGCDHTVWQLPARWFAWHGSSVLAVDLPGHGRSEGPPFSSIADLGRWVAQLLDAAAPLCFRDARYVRAVGVYCVEVWDARIAQRSLGNSTTLFEIFTLCFWHISRPRGDILMDSLWCGSRRVAQQLHGSV